MNKQSSYNLAAFLLSAASLVAVVSCQDTNYPTPQPASGSSTVASRVQFVNASPDASTLNFLIENVMSASSVAPGQATGYLNAPAGSVAAAAAQLRIDNAGGTLGTTDIVTKPLLATNLAYTIFVTDTINRPRVTNTAGTVTDVGGVRGVQVTDNLTAPAAGNAHVRFFHFAPDVGTVSVRLLPSSPTSVTTTPAFNNRAYRATSVTSGTVTTNYANFTPVPAATYTAQVFSGTAVPPISSTVTPVLSVSGVTLVDGKIYTLYAQGLARRRTVSVGRIQHN